MKSIKCSECGGKISGDSCLSCRRKLQVRELELINDLNKMFDNYNSIIRKKIIEGKKLSIEEDDILKLLLQRDILDDNELDDSMILRCVLSNNKIISYETFEKVMERSAEKTIRQLNNGMINNYHPRVYILPLGKYEGCAIKHYTVELNKKSIEELYNGYISALETYFHEIRHVFQSFLIEKKFVNSNLITMIKDQIIREVDIKYNNSDNYYNDNYNNISYEIDAEQELIIRRIG